MNFYAYIPKADGTEPLGTSGKILFQLKTVRGAVRRCRNALGKRFRLYTYSSFYDESTFFFVKEES